MQDCGFDGTISIELEDVPGTASVSPRRRATEAFDREMALALDYLTAIARDLNIPID